MANDHLNDYDLFFQEIPATNDYLNGFDTEIEDHVEEEVPANQGLDADQVSRLAQDTIFGEEIIPKADNDDQGEQPLFEEEA